MPVVGEEQLPHPRDNPRPLLETILQAMIVLLDTAIILLLRLHHCHPQCLFSSSWLLRFGGKLFKMAADTIQKLENITTKQIKKKNERQLPSSPWAWSPQIQTTHSSWPQSLYLSEWLVRSNRAERTLATLLFLSYLWHQISHSTHSYSPYSNLQHSLLFQRFANSYLRITAVALGSARAFWIENATRMSTMVIIIMEKWLDTSRLIHWHNSQFSLCVYRMFIFRYLQRFATNWAYIMKKIPYRYSLCIYLIDENIC